MDFSENYRCDHQDQIQSAYYNYKQATIHPFVMLYSCPDCGDKVTYYLGCISDVLKHDANFVHAATQLAIKHLQERAEISSIIIFSDGCASQYKSKVPFHMLQELEEVASAKIIRCYFGSRHGKSQCDPFGGLIKVVAKNAVKNRQAVISSAADLYSFCTERLQLPASSTPTDCCHVRRSFVFLDSNVIKESEGRQLKTLPGTRQVHCLRPLGDNLLATRNLVCFCRHCIASDFSKCSNALYVNQWCVVKMAKKKSSSTPKPKILHKDLSEDEEDNSTSPQDGTALPHHSPDLSQVCPDTSQDGSELDPENLPHDCPPRSSNAQPPSTDAASPSSNAVPSASNSAPPSSEDAQADGQLARQEVFRELHEKLNAQSVMFSCLKHTAEEVAPVMHGYKLPSTRRYLDDQPVCVDKTALTIMPDDAPLRHFPVCVRADGNCLPRTLSMLLFGTEEHHQEMRCRLIVEHVLNEDVYLTGEAWGLTPGDLDLIAAVSDSYCGSLKATYRQNVLSITKSGTDMGVWQLMAAAVVLQQPLRSVYPNLGVPAIRALCNRSFCLQSFQPEQEISIMWSTVNEAYVGTAVENFVANHFVPLFPLPPSDPEFPDLDGSDDRGTLPVVGEFYAVMWRGTSYIAEVEEVDEERQIVLVNFMEETPDGLFFWPAVPDRSEEPFTSLVTKIQKMVLNEKKSSQRRQFFKAIF